MLADHEQDRLVELLVATAEVIGDQMRPTAAAFIVNDLAGYPLPALEKALAACRRELKGRLSLAAILERIDDGHPAPNEAWANAIRAADEAATVVWTEQTRDSWTAALPLIEAGDKIAARQAFLEVYTRLTKDARAAGQMAVHHASIGFDASGRDAVLQRAVAAGQLAHEKVAEHLALPITILAFNPLALLAGRVEASPETNERTLKRLAEIAGLFRPTQGAAV
ncbi:hypothetical protein CXF96_05450 [Stenotrophomonas sp. Betaine-02u-21]|uniref:hypothetical protein n=1 Tax=unclassified Stenotrophomonas TaxID=196198 RepID=UPI000C34491F|nr:MULTISPECIES: hypothetical protein [unclassified Stenotrophomonas]PKH70289.1 hypothetical protein CXF90_15455 [Stenotrophomonas sp. Betaine-02u-23]PKH75182.1 hypothetical protein CXF96_05450 [Stenotrophomonas sp. Betaine-02u-21]PKH97605.1 hypothetical protein CXG43_01880 [Stenotrophomonas sp. Bg11-02]